MKPAILCFGEILFDIFPEYQRLGGAPFNFAYHMHSLGHDTTLTSRVGDDDNGREILNFAKKNVGIDSIQIDLDHETGKVLIQLDDKGIPAFDIVENDAYDYIDLNGKLEKLLQKRPSLIYFGTLAQRNQTSRSTLEKILSSTTSASVFYDMNLRQHYFSKEIIERSLRASNIVKLNDDELNSCKSLFQGPDSDEAYLLDWIVRFDLDWICLTRGEKGSELYHKDDHVIMGHVPQKSVADTVGAGDAYTSILALGILNHWSAETILNRAT